MRQVAGWVVEGLAAAAGSAVVDSAVAGWVAEGLAAAAGSVAVDSAVAGSEAAGVHSGPRAGSSRW